MKNKINNIGKKKKHVKQNNKTRLTQKKNKTLKLCKTKNKKREKK